MFFRALAYLPSLKSIVYLIIAGGRHSRFLRKGRNSFGSFWEFKATIAARFRSYNPNAALKTASGSVNQSKCLRDSSADG
uniref:Uncharacterized protein n=1 Tax=Arundo donax TaxID=35708 RepID=A0A0A9CJ23_ARUDO